MVSQPDGGFVVSSHLLSFSFLPVSFLLNFTSNISPLLLLLQAVDDAQLFLRDVHKEFGIATEYLAAQNITSLDKLRAEIVKLTDHLVKYKW